MGGVPHDPDAVCSRGSGGRWLSGSHVANREEEPLLEASMLWTIFVILLVLWLLGLVSGTTMGGFVHLLLLIALVVVIIQVISGRRGV
jgi:hypothetical protein